MKRLTDDMLASLEEMGEAGKLVATIEKAQRHKTKIGRKDLIDKLEKYFSISLIDFCGVSCRAVWGDRNEGGFKKILGVIIPWDLYKLTAWPDQENVPLVQKHPNKLFNYIMDYGSFRAAEMLVDGISMTLIMHVYTLSMSKRKWPAKKKELEAKSANYFVCLDTGIVFNYILWITDDVTGRLIAEQNQAPIMDQVILTDADCVDPIIETV